MATKKQNKLPKALPPVIFTGQVITVEEERKLTPKQEKFCELFASDREFFGNGTQAYIEAYNINLSEKGAYQSAMASASRLLSNVKILARIDKHLEDLALNDQHVEKQLGYWITQKLHPQAAVSAIKEYHVLKGKVQGGLIPQQPTTVNNTQFNFNGKEMTEEFVEHFMKKTKTQNLKKEAIVQDEHIS